MILAKRVFFFFPLWFLLHHRLNTRDMLNRKINIYPYSNVSVAHKVLKKHCLISSLTETWHSIAVLGQMSQRNVNVF